MQRLFDLRLLVTVTAIAVLYAPICYGPVWTGNNGDPLRFTFRDGQKYAAKVVTEFAANDLPANIDPEVRAWLIGNRAPLLKTIQATRQGWVQDEMAMTSCARAGWARLDNPEVTCTGAVPGCGPVVYLSYDLCGERDIDRVQAAQVLIHEACHHLGMKKEAFCDDVALSSYDAWLLSQDIPLGKWQSVSNGEAPFEAGQGTRGVWTGERLFVSDGLIPRTRGIDRYSGWYDPRADTWTEMIDEGALPLPRFPTVTWNGRDVFIWGGHYNDDEIVNFGALVDPISNRWRAVALEGAPTPRMLHSSVWTGDRFLIWGGKEYARANAVLNDGGAYDPVNNHWTKITTQDAPSPRQSHVAVWTGSRMLVWGGFSSQSLSYSDGAIYDPALDKWFPMSTKNAPPKRRNWYHGGAWNGDVLFVWGVGGGQGSGGLYDPGSDTWHPVSEVDGFDGVSRPTVLWTGSKFLVFASARTPGVIGAAYDPVTDRWSQLAPAPDTGMSYYPFTVWTGKEAMMWGRGSPIHLWTP